MLTRIARKRTGLAGVLALAGFAMTACAHQEPDPATVAVFGADERDGGSAKSRQVAVRVAPGGGVEWEGRAVSPEELQMLMQQAAMTSRDHLLVVVSASGEVKYADVFRVVQMARVYGIESKLADTLGSAE
jgi:biopolymer transport protein ExbD